MYTFLCPVLDRKDINYLEQVQQRAPSPRADQGPVALALSGEAEEMGLVSAWRRGFEVT